MSDLLISIIMPTYKAADTVQRAVASVLAQSWDQFELIMAVDDGVDYEALLRDAGIADRRIRQVFTSGTGSAGNGTGDWSARNTGLAAATGDLVTLLDSDDAYAPGRLSHMAPLALADGAALDDTRIFLEGQIVASLLHEDEAALGRPIIATTPLILRDRVPVFPMWRRDLADLRWRNLPHASDVVFSLEVLSAAPSLKVAPYGDYEYFKRPGSMTMSASMTERSRAAYYQIIHGIVSGDYALSSAVADLALYEIAKNLNQAEAFGKKLADDPMLTHEICARAFNDRPMTEADRYDFFTGEDGL